MLRFRAATSARNAWGVMSRPDAKTHVNESATVLLLLQNKRLLHTPGTVSFRFVLLLCLPSFVFFLLVCFLVSPSFVLFRPPPSLRCPTVRDLRNPFEVTVC